MERRRDRLHERTGAGGDRHVQVVHRPADGDIADDAAHRVRLHAEGLRGRLDGAQEASRSGVEGVAERFQGRASKQVIRY
ncbi:MAG: hypothetical protein AMXMBFR23_04320 [Chloroflexota bacterium]